LGHCHNFVLGIKTASKNQIEHERVSAPSPSSLQSQPDGEFRDFSIEMRKKTERRTVTIPGQTNIDLQLVIDYSSSFYPADLTLVAG
jgi:hypothetical protein